jgi:hypothetical protein
MAGCTTWCDANGATLTFSRSIMLVIALLSWIVSADILHYETYNRRMEFHLKSLAKAQRLARRDVSDIVLSGNNQETLYAYHGKVGIGSPPQNFSVLFDTGSYQFWVRSSRCNISACVGQDAFNGADSSTYSTKNQMAQPINYLDGSSVQAILARDRVALGSLSVDNYQFLEAISTDAASNDTDGIMGMSFSPQTSLPTVFSSLVNTNTLTSPVFSYFIDNTETSGGLTVGGVDVARYSGNLSWISVEKSSPLVYWQASVLSIKVGSESLDIAPSFYGIIDTVIFWLTE